MMSLRILFALILFTPIGLLAQDRQIAFDQWLVEYKQQAIDSGITPDTIDRALSGISPIERVIELDRQQPEFTMTFGEYRDRIVNPIRIRKGRKLYRQYYDELQSVANRYGVPAKYIVALWGIESNFGVNTGGFDIIPALATLAYDGRRAEFFTRELNKALTIVQQGHKAPDQMTGSWAGAMGQVQFMPSSFLNFAVDYDRDGRKDIWSTKADIFASAANYLSENGWDPEYTWGRPVTLTQDIPDELLGRKSKRPLSFWAGKGVRRMDGRALPTVNIDAGLIRPGDGPADNDYFLVYDNFDVIMRWNASSYFATSVGLLANEIAR